MNGPVYRLGLAFTFLLLFLSSCGEDGLHFTSQGDTKTSYEQVYITVPPGAIKQSSLTIRPTKLFIKKFIPSQGSVVDERFSVAGAVRLHPKGATFHQPITVILPLESPLPPGTHLPVYHRSNSDQAFAPATLSKGQPIHGIVGPGGKFVLFSTDHFSEYLLSAYSYVPGFARNYFQAQYFQEIEQSGTKYRVFYPPTIEPSLIFHSFGLPIDPRSRGLDNFSYREARYKEVLRSLFLQPTLPDSSVQATGSLFVEELVMQLTNNPGTLLNTVGINRNFLRAFRQAHLKWSKYATLKNTAKRLEKLADTFDLVLAGTKLTVSVSADFLRTILYHAIYSGSVDDRMETFDNVIERAKIEKNKQNPHAKGFWDDPAFRAAYSSLKADLIREQHDTLSRLKSVLANGQTLKTLNDLTWSFLPGWLVGKVLSGGVKASWIGFAIDLAFDAYNKDSSGARRAMANEVLMYNMELQAFSWLPLEQSPVPSLLKMSALNAYLLSMFFYSTECSILKIDSSLLIKGAQAAMAVLWPEGQRVREEKARFAASMKQKADALYQTLTTAMENARKAEVPAPSSDTNKPCGDKDQACCSQGDACKSSSLKCVNGLCQSSNCQPQCDNKQCGNDGCGSVCGTCPVGTTCNTQQGRCVSTCQNECSTQGQRVCTDTSRYNVCDDHNKDTCLSWKSFSCATGQRCLSTGCFACQKEGRQNPPASPPVSIAAGGTRQVEIVFTNKSEFAWIKSGQGVSDPQHIELWTCDANGNIIDSPFAHTSWINTRRISSLALQTRVNPGDNARFIFKVKAPSTPGEKKLYVIPVIAGVPYPKVCFGQAYFSFAVQPAATISITSPRQGDVMEKGKSYTVSWTSTQVQGPLRIVPVKAGKEIPKTPSENWVITVNGKVSGSLSFSPVSSWADGNDYQICGTALGGTVSGCSGLFSIRTKSCVCTANQTRCNGKALERCQSDCLKWVVVQQCPGLCQNGQCVACSCSAGMKRCSNGRVEQCNNCQWSTLEDCGSKGQVCFKASCCASSQEVCDGKDNDCDGQTDEGQLCSSGLSCQNGTCVSTCSPSTLTRCNGSCVNTQTNNLHCGGCSRRCSTSYTCQNGKCLCPPGTRRCGTVCINVFSNDRNHCGGCNLQCNNDEACTNGKCTCNNGGLSCGGTCVLPNSNTDHCGKCYNKCSLGMSCSNGRCVCRSGQTLCSSSCVDLNSSRYNCGACGKRCGSGEKCTQGKCGCSSSASCGAGKYCDKGTCKSMTHLRRWHCNWSSPQNTDWEHIYSATQPTVKNASGQSCPGGFRSDTREIWIYPLSIGTGSRATIDGLYPVYRLYHCRIVATTVSYFITDQVIEYYNLIRQGHNCTAIGYVVESANIASTLGAKVIYRHEISSRSTTMWSSDPKDGSGASFSVKHSQAKWWAPAATP